MTEAEWVEKIKNHLQAGMIGRSKSLEVKSGLRLSYGHEIIACREIPDTKSTEFQTDLAVIEILKGGGWKPRVVMEAKVGSISTHDAITYSHKAGAHKAVYPYLRYGVMLGNRAHHPLPGRLYRHGGHFDFMISFKGYNPEDQELHKLNQILRAEVAASRTMESIIYQSRMRKRDHYKVLHRRLVVS